MAIRAIVTDIEGTTSDIAFVKDVLFPYAAARLPDFVHSKSGDSKIAPILDDVAQLSGRRRGDTEGLISALLQWIDEDRKITALKSLQGMIWKDGYVRGEFCAHIYDDAAARLQQWYGDGMPLYVYSSGSIAAQKLFFGHCSAGNLAPLFRDFFDTTTGGKREAASYRAIASSIDCDAGSILFLSDIVEELDAAATAGMKTVWVQRDESLPLQSAAPHQSVRRFDEIAI